MEILCIYCSDLAHGCIQEYYDVLSEYLGDARWVLQYLVVSTEFWHSCILFGESLGW